MLKLLGGFLMAMADSVPGVSGGTILFLLGLYDNFISSLSKLISGTKEERIDALKFLIRLGIGWVLGFVLAVLVITSLFESHIYQVSSVFLGFIIFSIPIVMKQEKEVIKGKYVNLIYTALGMAIVIAITMLNPSGGAESAGFTLTLGSGIYVFAVGMVAISAMVLPGISGSTLLLIFGLYMPVMSAIKGVLHFEFSNLPVCIIFGLGVIAGILLVIKLVDYMLKNHRSQTIYAIIGLMIGSLYSIVQGPTTLDVPKPAMSFDTFHILFFLLGGVIIFGLQLLQSKKEEK